MKILGFEEDKSRELMSKYSYFIGFWQGRDVIDLKNADAFDLLEAIDEFRQVGMDRVYSNFLCDADLISEELLKYALDYSLEQDYGKFVSCYKYNFSIDLIIDMLIANIDYRVISQAVNKVDKVKKFSLLVSAAQWGLSTPDIILLIDKTLGKANKSQIEELIEISGEEIYPNLSSFIEKLNENDQNELNEKYY